MIHFRRTATADTELSGQQIEAGQKVVLFYNSANRDERMYPDPYRFDITRPITPAQVGFGAGGPHFCLGANLARREITVMFDELRRRVPGPAHHRRAGLPREPVHQRDQAPALRLGGAARTHCAKRSARTARRWFANHRLEDAPSTRPAASWPL